MRLIVCMLTLLVISFTLAHAADAPAAETPTPGAYDPSVYEPVGAPSNPVVEAHWDRYHDYGQATQLLKDLAAAHPQFAHLESLGKSYGGREMWVLTLTDFGKGDAARKPGFWVDGAIHANEIQASEVVLYTAWYLLEARPYSPFVAEQLAQHTFYLMPMMSPDSRDAHFHEPNTSSSPRSGERPIDNDRDGLVDEDGPDDLDGDGNITMMRVKDPNGRWKENKDYPLQMQRADPDEPGQYTLFYEEGYDNDGDGEINEDDKGGYDPNRDWPWFWQPGYVQWGAWKYPLSVDENRLVANFIIAHPNIAGAQTYHNNGGMILHGPGQSSDYYPDEDNALYNFIGKKGEEMLPGYKNMRLWDELYPVWGGEIDWLYKMEGALTFTNEMFNSFEYFDRKPDPAAGWRGSRDDQLEFDKYLLFGEGYVPWHEVNHPQLGKVEVGGAKKTWGRQPPSFLLEEECHRNFAFTMYHAEQLPKLEVQEVTMRPVAGGLTEVTATVANRAAIPTHLAIDRQNRITRPDWITVKGSTGFNVIAGYQGENQFFLKNTEQKHNPQRMEVGNIAGNGAVYLRWLVGGKGPFVVTVDSVKGGLASGTSAQS